MATITGSFTSGYTIATSPVYFAASASVTNGGGPAVTSTLSSYLTLNNQGILRATGTGTTSNGVALNTGARIVNQAGGKVSGYAMGVSLGGNGTVVNSGSITATQASGNSYSYNSTTKVLTPLTAAVALPGGGVSNAATGVISSYFEGVALGGNGGSVTNAGTISAPGTAAGFGVVLAGGNGSVTNVAGGTITAGRYAVLGLGASVSSITNQGLITGTYSTGIDLFPGGTVTNTNTGIISGRQNAIVTATKPSTVSNDGQLTGTLFGGVVLQAGGVVTNTSTGRISGAYFGVRAATNAGTVTNAGTISSSQTFANQSGFDAAGVALWAGGTVTNAAGAMISATWMGVQIGTSTVNATGTISNSGTIFASNASGNTGAALWLHGQSMVTNNAGGVITGGPYGIVSYAPLTIVNRGTISGSAYALDPVTPGFAAQVEVAPGAVFIGTVSGGNTIGSSVSSTLELLSGPSAGTINGFNTQFVQFANVQVDSGATWSLNGTVTAGQTIAFNGANASLTLGSPTAMAGTIAGFASTDSLVLAGVSNATGFTIGGNHLVTVSVSGSTPVTLQLDPTQSLDGQTVSLAASGANTILTLTAGVPDARMSTVYQSILQQAPTASDAAAATAQINGNTLTLAQYEASLLASPAALSSVLPALIVIDQFYGVTPGSAVLAAVSGTVQNWASLGMSVADQWSVLGMQFAHNGTFGALYDALDNYTFAGQIYQAVFGTTPSASIQTTLSNNVTALAAAYKGYDPVHSDMLGGKGALYAALLYYAENAKLGYFYTDANAFLTAQANAAFASGTVPTYAQSAELKTQFPSGMAVPPAAQAAAPTLITASGTTIDPGGGDHVIQFAAGAANDTLVLHAGGTDQIAGFDISAGDALSVHALLAEAGVTVTDFTQLPAYLSVTAQGSDAVLSFQPRGGAASAIAVLQGLGGSVTSLDDLTRHGAIVT